MGIFGSVMKAIKGATRDIAKEYKGNSTFLRAVCASAALTANADGDIADTERKASIDLISNHDTLKSMYTMSEIQNCLQSAFDHSKSNVGKQSLARDLQGVRTGTPEAVTMAQDVYLIAADIADAGGNVSDEEKAVMAKIANYLGVNPTDFMF